MKEDEVLEFTFRSIRKKPRRSGAGCPQCGETTVAANGKTYICGYSSSSKGVTPCKNEEANELVADDTFIGNLKKSFHDKKQKQKVKEITDEFFEQLKKMD